MISPASDGRDPRPVAWCVSRADALDIAEQWAREFPATVLLRRAGGERVETYRRLPRGWRAG